MTATEPPPDPAWWLLPSILVAALLYGMGAWAFIHALRTW